MISPYGPGEPINADHSLFARLQGLKIRVVHKYAENHPPFSMEVILSPPMKYVLEICELPVYVNCFANIAV